MAFDAALKNPVSASTPGCKEGAAAVPSAVLTIPPLAIKFPLTFNPVKVPTEVILG